MAQCQSLESIPFAEFVLPFLNAQQKVFVPYPVQPFTIYAWFVRTDHTGQERLTVEVLPDVLRPFVNTEEITYSVPGAVSEVPPEAPQRLSGKRVNLAARRPFGEYRHCKVNVPLQHQGIVRGLKFGTGAQGNGSGYVCGPELVLTARIALRGGVRGHLSWV